MDLSTVGSKLAMKSGIRAIMEDVASADASPSSGWINLSIGNPAKIPQVVSQWQRLAVASVAESFAEFSCQYGPSRGAPELIEEIRRYFGQRYGWSLSDENIVVGPGSQMLCFAAAALFSGAGDHGMRRLVLPVTPDYTGYQGIGLMPGGVVGMEAGISTEGDRRFRYLCNLSSVESRQDIGMLLVSSPGNPTGRAVSPGELDGLRVIAERSGAPLVLDHAYGEPFPGIGAIEAGPLFDPAVLNLFSFSKAGLPGERLGFAIGPEDRINAIVSVLSNSVLHASRLVQNVAARALASGAIDDMVELYIRPFYERRRKLAEEVLESAMPDAVAWRLHSGVGGMFLWIWVDEDWFDDLRLYELLKLKKVFVTPGRHFFVGPPALGEHGRHATRCFRVSLTVPEEELVEGIRTVGEAVREIRGAVIPAPWGRDPQA
jgi:valine--pyruvate aminotransferase